MHAGYDENLKDNPFYSEIVKKHFDIIKRAAEERWIICIPRSGTIETNEISIQAILDQVLIPHDDGILRSYQTCSTLSKKRLQIRKNQIVIDDCQFFSDTINILFKETFYEGNGRKYTVWCIDKPLYLDHPFCGTGVQVLESLPDCIDFLWVESSGQDVLQQIQNLCMKFIESSSNFEWEHIQSQKDIIGNLYSKCLQKALKNANIQSKATDNEQFLEKLKLAVETYMQYCLGKKILFGISTFLVDSDVGINKIIKYSDSVSDKDLGISFNYVEALSMAKFEISKLNNSVTILDKVNCLDRTFNAICGTKNGNFITSDDVLQIFISLILKVKIYNWVSNLYFIKDFKFCSSTFTEHVNYLLATLEAAIEYIKSSNFLELSESLNVNSSKGNEIFHLVEVGDLSSLKVLIENSNDLDFREKLCHPLCLCHKCEEVTRSILVDKEIRNDKDQTLLMYASIFEQTAIVEYLLSIGVNLNSQDCLGKCALHYAMAKGYQDIILLLVTDDNIDINIQDNNGDTPLHSATALAHASCINAIIYSSTHLDTTIINNNNETPLHLAAKLGYLSIVKVLLENSPPLILDSKIRSVLNVCHNFTIKNYIEQFSIKKVLPTFAYGERKSKLDEDVSICAKFGVKPKTEDDSRKICLLINAIKNNDLPLTCFYLGFDHTKQEDNSPKCHPLCDCEKCQKNGDITDGIETESNAFSNYDLHEKIHVNMCNVEGYTPLHVASQYGRSSILRILLDGGAQVNIQTYKNFYTPLHLACLYQQISIVKELVKCSNCDVNIKDFQGNTPIFYACSKNDSRIIELLLKNDAEYDIKNSKGLTVWDICQKKMLYCAFKALKNNIQNISDAASTENSCV